MKRALDKTWLAWLAICATALAQEPAAPKKPADLDAASLPLRTALYHDPTLAPPLDRLLQLHREAGKVKDLVDVYRQHVAQFPTDAGALVVLTRLLAATNDAEAPRMARAAAERFPDHAYLQYLHFEQMQKAREPGALDVLARAIAKETLPARKRVWIDQLIPLAVAEGRGELAQKQLEQLATESATAEAKLEIARKMIAQKFYAPALATLEAAAALKPAAETGVDIDLAAASTELGLKRDAAAAARLDRLLGKLAADYWRRTEILHRRTALVKSDADREAMLAAARARWKAAPGNDTAALELAQLLTAFEFRREALDTLLTSARQQAASEKVEKAALELFDLLRDERGREAFLADRLKAAPDRQDLALARAKSLFLLGRRDEAKTAFDVFTARIAPPERLNQLLEMARFLRRSALPADAAAIFQRAVSLAPDRLDARRELAETWLAAGQKSKAREVFAGNLPDDAATENLLDVIQFFLKQEMFIEARDALAARVAKEPQNFDLRLMQVTVAARLADRAAGEKFILETRGLADTEARYRRWLEGSIAFHEAFETQPGFLAEEQERLFASTASWDGDNGARRLIFLELGAVGDGKSTMAALLERALKEELPNNVRTELRRRRLALLERDPAQSKATEEQLRALMKEDPAREAEYRIRLILLVTRNQRGHQFGELLGRDAESIDVSKISDATLLSGLESILGQFGSYPRLRFDLLERMTAIDPTNRGAWERWIGAIAMSGDEDRLRSVLRQLLAGVDRLPLSDETRVLLKEHLLASHWRSVAEMLRSEDDESSSASEALPLLDAAGRLAAQRDEWLWITWTRAYVLNRLGRKDARDEAIRELERVAALAPTVPAPAASEEAPKPAPDTIAFPDGLIIGLGQARELLTAAPSPAKATAPADGDGPRGNLKAGWAFETDGRSPVARVLPLDKSRVIVIDNAGRLYCVDSSSGKLRWSQSGPRPAPPQRDDYSGYLQYRPPVIPAIDAGRIYLPMGGDIECWSADDGRLLWRATDIVSGGGVQGVLPTLFVRAGQVLVCDGAQGRLVALDPQSGKMRWEREYPRSKEAGPVYGLNSGASLSDGRLLLYGAATVVVSAATGDVLWSFDARRARTFPISLAAPGTTAVASPAPTSMAYSRRSSWGGTPSQQFIAMDYSMRRQSGSFVYGGGMGQGQIAFTNSAAAWATNTPHRSGTRFAVLQGNRMLLFSDQGMWSVRLDLPFTTAYLQANGTFLGSTADRAFLLSGEMITSVSLESGKWETIGLSPVERMEDPDDESEEMPVAVSRGVRNMRAAVGSSLIYVSENDGISAWNPRTRQRVFQSTWPKSVAPKVTATQPEQAQYTLHGRMRYNNNGQYSAIEPMTGLVTGGVFYVESEPGRLVALANAKGER